MQALATSSDAPAPREARDAARETPVGPTRSRSNATRDDVDSAAEDAGDATASTSSRACVVLSLGRAVVGDARYANGARAFCDGYRARRDAAANGSLGTTTASIEATSFGPLFRVVLHDYDDEAFVAHHPGTATREAKRFVDRATGRRTTCPSYDDVFGFSDPSIEQRLSALPNMDKVVGYVRPTVRNRYRMSEAEVVERRRREAIENAGADETPSIFRTPSVEKCDVCDSVREFDQDVLVQCDECMILVHMGCYGVTTAPTGGRWLCRACELGLRTPPRCALCPNVGGAMKPTLCGRWCHVVCALWAECTFAHPDGVAEPIEGVDTVPAESLKATCAVCEQSYGACAQCMGTKKCQKAFHVYCARDAECGYIAHSRTVAQLKQAGIRKFIVGYEQPLRNTDTLLFPSCPACANWRGRKRKRRASTPKKRTQTPKTRPTVDSREVEDKDEDAKPLQCAKFDPLGAYARALTVLPKDSIPYLVTGARTSRLESFSLRAVALADPPRNLNERFERMKATISDRLTLGKSYIHGYGLFAKRAHARGEMIIDYVGEIVRPVVADIRERDVYDTCFGNGTYIFALGGDDQPVRLDATCAGNLANLANHSCAPNAHSRQVYAANDNHICLFASRNIQPGEEILYEYRLGADQTLRCNCGAANCRGVVNFTAEHPA